MSENRADFDSHVLAIAQSMQEDGGLTMHWRDKWDAFLGDKSAELWKYQAYWEQRDRFPEELHEPLFQAMTRRRLGI